MLYFTIDKSPLSIYSMSAFPSPSQPSTQLILGCNKGVIVCIDTSLLSSSSSRDSRSSKSSPILAYEKLHDDDIRSLFIHGDNYHSIPTLVTSSYDDTAAVWTLSNNRESVQSTHLSMDSAAGVGVGIGIRRPGVSTSDTVLHFSKRVALLGHTDKVLSIASCGLGGNSGDVVSSSADGTVRLWKNVL